MKVNGKSLAALVVCFGLGIVLLIQKHITRRHKKSKFTIGIIKTVSHPALDNAEKGFMQHLYTLLDHDVSFISQNAHGSVAQAHLIAKNFHANSEVDAIFAIATPAAQAAANVEKEKPIFIAAVTDPAALGLIHPTTNVTGCSDMIDIKGQICMLTQLLPKVKTVAMLFNPGEINSVTAANQMKEELDRLNIAHCDVGLTSAAEVKAATLLACSCADAILAPTDNTVASTLPTIAHITRQAKKPLIVSDNLLVELGALASRGVNYHECGSMAAELAFRVLVEKKTPCSLPIVFPACRFITLNKSVLEELGLQVRDEIIDQCIFVSGEDHHA